MPEIINDLKSMKEEVVKLQTTRLWEVSNSQSPHYLYSVFDGARTELPRFQEINARFKALQEEREKISGDAGDLSDEYNQLVMAIRGMLGTTDPRRFAGPGK